MELGSSVLLLLYECARFGENRNVRKRIVGTDRAVAKPGPGPRWMDLGEIATVEVTSEDPGFPIESVFNAKAAQAGEPRKRASSKSA